MSIADDKNVESADRDQTVATNFLRESADRDQTVATNFLRESQHSLQTAVTQVSAAGATGDGRTETLMTVRQNFGAQAAADATECGADETLTVGMPVARSGGAQRAGTPQIPGYEIICVLGEGGMGVVYEAQQLALHRVVALKVLKPAVAAEPEFRERFLRESAAAGKVSDPHVVQIFDAGEADGHLYMTFQLVRGGDLSQLLKRKGILSEYKALSILRECTLGIQAIEQAGLVHRDIKPGNIFMDDGRHAVIGDLGLARESSGDDRMTMTGAAMGTPAYMSPEHIQGIADVDIRTDIYALGSTLYKMLTGEEPFKGDTVFAITHSILSEPIPDPRILNPSLSNPIIGILRKSMEKDRDQRYRTSAQLLQDIDAAMAGSQLVHGEGFGKIEGLPKKEAVAAEPQKKERRVAFMGSAYGSSLLIRWFKPATCVGLLIYFIYLVPMLMDTSQGRWQPAWADAHGQDKYGHYVDLRLGDYVQRLRLIRADGERGSFVMGSPAKEKGYRPTEAQQAVHLNSEYWLADSETTQALWAEVMGAENHDSEYQDSYFPVHNITWKQANIFCKKVQARMQKRLGETALTSAIRVRLPSEKEWEFACRAQTSNHPYGDQQDYTLVGHCAAPDIQKLWLEEWEKSERSDVEIEVLALELVEHHWQESDGDTQQTKKYSPLRIQDKQANKWGVYGMIGNVGEWCSDTWDGETAYSDTQMGDFHMVRGGSWLAHPQRCRAATRMAMAQEVSASFVGMRLLIEIPSAE